jgi:hypothetical protein
MKKNRLNICLWTIALCLLSSGFISCGDDNNPPVDPPAATLSAPTDLQCDRREKSFMFTWEKVTGAESYEIAIEGGNTYTTSFSYYLLTEKLNYDTQYTWKVRAIGKGIQSEWASATFTTLPTPVFLKYVGVWKTESFEVKADFGGNPIPVDDYLPDTSQAEDLSIIIVENAEVENGVILSVSGLEDYIPVGSEALNQVPMTANLETGKIYADVPVNNNKITRDLDPPVKLIDLPVYDQIKEQAGMLAPMVENVEISQVTLVIDQIIISGELDKVSTDKANYVITALGYIQIKSNNVLIDTFANQALQDNKINVRLSVNSIKEKK